jgi:hypothetical protein
VKLARENREQDIAIFPHLLSFSVTSFLSFILSPASSSQKKNKNVMLIAELRSQRNDKLTKIGA